MLLLAPSVSLVFVGVLWLLALGGFATLSHYEQQPRAARLSGGLAALGGGPLLLGLLAPTWLALAVLALLLLCLLVLVLLLLIPIGAVEPLSDLPTQRYDERDIVFARARLVPGTLEHDAYYARRPENKVRDEAIRRLPGLLSPNARRANPFAFAAADASFDLTEALFHAVDGEVCERRVEIAQGAATDYVKAAARFFGARSVGIAALSPYHYYSHVGRGSGEYGSPITADHPFGIAVTVEMAHSMLAPAPDPPVVMESAHQYVEAARIAVQLAALIRRLGYPARAHIDGNYRVIAPLVARDAGLGEIGRIGLLITPNLGPRVRLAVVTTELELIPDARRDGSAVIDFCTSCKKCALNCPSNSIPTTERQEVDGAHRWLIDPETCYRYWNLIGTDCGRCVAVCPHSHPENFGHNLVRWVVSRSGFGRRAALRMDDLFYGRKPAPGPSPGWIPRLH